MSLTCEPLLCAWKNSLVNSFPFGDRVVHDSNIMQSWQQNTLRDLQYRRCSKSPAVTHSWHALHCVTQTLNMITDPQTYFSSSHSYVSGEQPTTLQKADYLISKVDVISENYSFWALYVDYEYRLSWWIATNAKILVDILSCGLRGKNKIIIISIAKRETCCN